MVLNLENNKKVRNILLKYNLDLDLIENLNQIQTTKYILIQLNIAFKKLKTSNNIKTFMEDINALNIDITIRKNRFPYSEVILDINNSTTTRINVLDKNSQLSNSCYIVNLHKYFKVSI